jgi:hypothetical protein
MNPFICQPIPVMIIIRSYLDQTMQQARCTKFLIGVLRVSGGVSNLITVIGMSQMGDALISSASLSR